MEIGSIHIFAGTVTPTGFLMCDGSAVSRDTYASLFSVIGTLYGSGDGSATFNLPDLVGKLVVGCSQTYQLGSTGGEETHTLLEAELPQHSHNIPSHGHANNILAKTPSLSHSVTQPVFKYNSPSGSAQCNSGSSVTGYSGTSSATASRSASVAISNHTGNCTMGGGVLDAAAFDTASTGSGDAHENMQPYVAMNYVIYSGV